jgi:tetratricopeptide (TPR) repeat protein
MTEKDALALIFSALALAVAVYGIFERRHAAYAALRVRITELLDEVQALNVSEGQYTFDHVSADWDAQRSVGGSFAGRRALLTYQALALLRRLRSARRLSLGRPYRLTPEEHGALAQSLESLRDYPTACAQWEDAVAASRQGTQFVQATMSNGYAQCLFRMGRTDAARSAYRSAIATYSDDDAGRWDRFCTYTDWLELERGIRNGHTSEPLSGAHELAQEPSYWQASAQRVLRDIDSGSDPHQPGLRAGPRATASRESAALPDGGT